MTNKTYANWIREPKGNTKHYTNPVFVWRSTQKHAGLKTCANWGRGRRENKSTIESRCLWSEENGTNKRPRGITRPRRGGDKLKQWSEQITRNEINSCKGAGFCWGVSTLAGATGGWARAGVAGTPAWTGTWASAITWFCARRILKWTGPKWYANLLFVTVFGKNGLNEICVEPFFSATHFETLKCIQKHSQCILKRLQRSPTEIENVPYHWKIISKHSENVYKRWLASLIFLCIRIHSKSVVTSRIRPCPCTTY